MKYTEHGLKITLDELRCLLDYAENRAQYANMEQSIYIQGGENPRITQYCCYSECAPINHTCNVR